MKRHNLIPLTLLGSHSSAQPTLLWWASWEAAFTATICRCQLWPMQSTPSITIAIFWPASSSSSWLTAWSVLLEFMVLQVRTLRHFSQALTWSSRTAWTWCHLRTIWRLSSAHASFASCCAWTHWSLASFVRKFYSSTKAREIRACRVMISTKGCQGERTLCFRVWLPYLRFLSLFGTHMWALSAHWWPLSRLCSSSTFCRWPRSRKRFTFSRKNHLRRMTTFRWRSHREFNLSKRWKRMIRNLIVTLQDW